MENFRPDFSRVGDTGTLFEWVWSATEPPTRRGRKPLGYRPATKPKTISPGAGELVYREWLSARYRNGEPATGLDRSLQAQAQRFLALWIPRLRRLPWARWGLAEELDLAALLTRHEVLRYAVQDCSDWRRGVMLFEDTPAAFLDWKPRIAATDAVQKWNQDRDGRRYRAQRLTAGETAPPDVRLDAPFPDGWPELPPLREVPVLPDDTHRTVLQWDQYFASDVAVREALRDIFRLTSETRWPKQRYRTALRRLVGGRELLRRAICSDDAAARAVLWDGGHGFPPLLRAATGGPSESNETTA